MRYRALAGLLILGAGVLVLACGKGGSEADGPPDRVPPETKVAEMKDSTRFDPAEPEDTAAHDPEEGEPATPPE
ncbi:MAG TPA: hypothetical protein PK112_08590 [candidate division Zixibacteria bacterium]|nr:hypothetical protein [candidate division Zixibacteria bacterium]